MSLISSSTVPPKTNYDVFLSFRGSDTRINFTSHLYAALRRSHITTFVDDTRLERGEEISPNLLKAIEESKMSIVIFSKYYASSRWCLTELVHIIECMKSIKRMVLPIFYHVDPTDVRNQTGIFADGFLKVKERCGDVEMIERWISVLKEAANLSGWDSNNYRSESELCEAVVKQILNKLYPAYYSACSNLCGIDSHINKLLSFLSLGSKDVRFIGIWGMGGIGKTTIAEVLLSRISDQFDDCCFESNIREKSEKDKPVHLRKCLFSKLLQNENLSMEMYHVIPTFVLDMLRRKKVFIVLDDVNDFEQLEALAGNHDWFGPGSRVIVTSRDKEVLNNGVDDIYEVKGLKDSDSFQLLSMKAFKQKHPPKDFIELSVRVVKYAKGVPLALKVLGSHLCKRSQKEWESALDKLKQFPDSKIQKILEVSYDMLEQNEKDIFLDIACFFKGQDKDWVEDILNGGGAASMGINRLKDKCLVVIDKNKLEMHDLIQEMGQDIARRTDSQLWNSTNIYDTLITEMMKEAVEGIFLDMSKIGKVHLHHTVFSRMPNLRLLKFYRSWPRLKDTNIDAIFETSQTKELQFLPNKLRLLHWEDYPYKSLPSNFFMENLVELNMKGSKVEQLWNGNKCPQRLKWLVLSESKHLKSLPDLSSASNLEEIILSSCKNLIDIPTSIQCLHKLVALDLHGCEKLRTLPKLAQLESLRFLCLVECSNLQMLLEVPRGIEILELEGCGLEEWSQDHRFFSNLEFLSIQQCKNLRSLPSIYLNSIEKLSLRYCSSLNKLPGITGNNIKELDLSYTAIEELPSTNERLSSLYELDVEGCKRLENLSVNICLLKSLGRLNLSGCSKLSKLPDLHGLCYLRQLFLNNCNKLEGLPKLPSQLEVLEASNCRLLKTAVSCIRPIEPGQLRGAAFKFNFVNCLNLDQNARSNIMGDAELRIKEIAICMVKELQLFYLDFDLALPGSETPEWFSFQTPGSSLNVDQLFPSNFISTLLDFAFCIVVEYQGPAVTLKEYSHFYLLVTCKCCLKTTKGNRQATITHYIYHGWPPFESDHVYLWYNHPETRDLSGWLRQNRDSVYEASFQFEAKCVHGGNVKLKRCGVHLLSAGNESRSQATDVNFMWKSLQSVRDSLHSRLTVIYEEEEQPPTRLKQLPRFYKLHGYSLW
ncbi:disease resistance protein RPV1 isoform X2 [Jatropha curcas]|uniref:disease resistance protein RPV1 isoform X2 n=1 Tax=Jatropha curcas TaxID=180498 RepID=UPI0005FB7300|nr:disease resistance protein RPV1 isoform X2 [Jatropha curcas]